MRASMLAFAVGWWLKTSFALLIFGAEAPVKFDWPTASAPESPAASGSATNPVSSNSFYDPKMVQTIRLVIDRKDLTRMREALPARITVPGKFEWNGTVIDKVGVRYKGNSSSQPNAKHKRSFLISIDEYEKGLSFQGLRQVALDNGVQFGSLFSERLITDILREIGIKASRCNYARLYLNGDFLGIYVNVERIDKAFLARNFGSEEGNLFKVDEGGPGGDLQNLEDKAQYERTFELHGGKKSEAYSELLKLVDAANQPHKKGHDLNRTFDWNSFIPTTAVMLFSGAFDQYTGWNAHNYYLFQNTTDHRWVYIPWDLDVGFADNAFRKIPVLKGWNAAWPAPVPGRPLLEHLIADENLLRQYRLLASNILEAHFKPEILIPKLHKLYFQIEKDLKNDPFPPRRATVPADKSYQDIIASMEQFIRTRYQSAQAQLKEPGQRPSFPPLSPRSEDRGPRPGPPSADAPVNLQAAKVTSSRVELTWVDRAQGEVAFVVQRSNKPEGDDFMNAIGQGGSDLTTAKDSSVEPGKTYRYRVYAVHPTPEGPRGTGVSNVISVTVPRK